MEQFANFFRGAANQATQHTLQIGNQEQVFSCNSFRETGGGGYPQDVLVVKKDNHMYTLRKDRNNHTYIDKSGFLGFVQAYEQEWMELQQRLSYPLDSPAREYSGLKLGVWKVAEAKANFEKDYKDDFTLLKGLNNMRKYPGERSFHLTKEALLPLLSSSLPCEFPPKGQSATVVRDEAGTSVRIFFQDENGKPLAREGKVIEKDSVDFQRIQDYHQELLIQQGRTNGVVDISLKELPELSECLPERTSIPQNASFVRFSWVKGKGMPVTRLSLGFTDDVHTTIGPGSHIVAKEKPETGNFEKLNAWRQWHTERIIVQDRCPPVKGIEFLNALVQRLERVALDPNPEQTYQQTQDGRLQRLQENSSPSLKSPSSKSSQSGDRSR